MSIFSGDSHFNPSEMRATGWRFRFSCKESLIFMWKLIHVQNDRGNDKSSLRMTFHETVKQVRE